MRWLGREGKTNVRLTEGQDSFSSRGSNRLQLNWRATFVCTEVHNETEGQDTTSQAFTVAKIHTLVFWVMTTGSMVGGYQHVCVEGLYILHLVPRRWRKCIFIQNVDDHLIENTKP